MSPWMISTATWQPQNLNVLHAGGDQCRSGFVRCCRLAVRTFHSLVQGFSSLLQSDSFFSQFRLCRLQPLLSPSSTWICILSKIALFSSCSLTTCCSLTTRWLPCRNAIGSSNGWSCNMSIPCANDRSTLFYKSLLFGLWQLCIMVRLLFLFPLTGWQSFSRQFHCGMQQGWMQWYCRNSHSIGRLYGYPITYGWPVLFWFYIVLFVLLILVIFFMLHDSYRG